MAPRKMHKLSSTSYSFMEQFLSEQWSIVREDQGNVDSKDKVSIDIIWQSFQSFMDDQGYSSALCNKILFGKLLHQAGVEKIKRGPRKQQRFYYFPIRPVEGSKTQELYRNHRAMEDLYGGFVSPPKTLTKTERDDDPCSSGPRTSAAVRVVKPVPLKLQTNAQRNVKVEVDQDVLKGEPFQKRSRHPCCLSHKPTRSTAPGCGLGTKLNKENAEGGSLEETDQKTLVADCAVTMNVCHLQDGSRNEDGKDFALDTAMKNMGSVFPSFTNKNTVGNGFTSSVAIHNASNDSSSGTGINFYNSHWNSAGNGSNNLSKQYISGNGRWEESSGYRRNLQNPTANIKRENSTTPDERSSNYLVAQSSFPSVALSYTDCFDPLFCPSSSLRTDHQGPVARRKDGEHSGWDDLPYVPNFVTHSMTGPFICWGTEANEGAEPLDLTTSSKQVA